MHEQTNTKDSSDVVVVLGPSSRYWEKIPAEKEGPERAPNLFYLEYYPWLISDFSDSIDFLTRAMHGTVYKIHSADQMGQAIQKMSEQVKQSQKATVSRFPDTP